MAFFSSSCFRLVGFTNGDSIIKLGNIKITFGKNLKLFWNNIQTFYNIGQNQSCGDKMLGTRKKIIIIHGWGGSYSDALQILRNRFDIKFYWSKGTFFCNKRDGLIIRRIIQDTTESSITSTYQKLLISQMLKSCTTPGIPEELNIDEMYGIHEKTLFRNFPNLNIPISYESRILFSDYLYKSVQNPIDKYESIFRNLLESIQNDNNCKSEIEISNLIHDRYPENGDEIISFLSNIRGMLETGGDLDTVASAVFYTYYLQKKSKKKLIYGKDYEYGFVNYHEGLRNLIKHGSGDILIADFPSGAIPDIEGDINFLKTHDIFIERFEDHHPYTKKTETIFKKLIKKGLIGFYELTGPREDQVELEKDQLLCGADMVHKNLIENTKIDCEGCRVLRFAAHSEDFASGRSELGRMITELIMTDICKIELVQLLLNSIPGANFIENMNIAGWTFQIKELREYYAQETDKLSENLFELTIERPWGDNSDTGGPAYGIGSDMPIYNSSEAKKDLKTIIALAPYTEPGSPRFYVGKAAEFYKELYPDADYLFYCYGSNIVVGRRLNQADLSLNLGELMPQIGSEGDGGHAGAAVGRPASNIDYPDKILGRVNSSNFKLFIKYLSYRLEGLGYNVKGIRNLSNKGPASPSKSARNIFICAAISVIVGLLLIIFSSKYRPEHVIQSNENFFPQIIISTPEDNEEITNEK